MCGITGVIQSSPSNLERLISSMLEEIAHRGPDAMGIWVSDKIAFGNARLAIVDLSTAQNQPMTIKGHTLVFNGEIYNYRELRSELELTGNVFRSDSDTEVVLQSFLTWGTESFKKFNGMWAIAIYDSASGNLILSRDRFGVKPLYYSSNSERIGFSSEIKGLLPLIPHRTMNVSYFARAISKNHSDDGSTTSLNEVFQVPGGCFVKIDRNLTITTEKWWQLETSPLNTNRIENLEKFRNIFEDSVKIRIPSGVNYGFSLSGGLDSTAVFGCAASNAYFGSTPSGIFNLAFQGGDLDESPLAAETSKIFANELTVILANPENLLSRIKDVVWSQEGIGWNSSILAYDFYYSKLREFGIKVILEGHGADEMYGGYPGMVSEFLFKKPIYIQPTKTFSLLNMANLGSNPEMGENQISSKFKLLSYFLRGYLNSNLGRLGYKTKERTHPNYSDEILDSIYRIQSLERVDNPQFSRKSFKSVIHNHVFCKTLPQVLRVFDRASMAHGIESRAPFLDYRLFEFGMSVPDSQLISDRYTKPIIRNGLTDFIPKHIRTQSVKRGFGAPLHRVFNSNATRKYLLSQEMRNLYANAEGINSKNLIKLLASRNSDLSADEIKSIWRATTFAIWQSKFL